MCIRDRDLLVRCGEIFGLLGPNGAGKTTIVGMLTSLVIPTSGKAFVSNIDVIKHPALVKQVIGMVSQSNNLDRALTVWENLFYHARYFGMTAKAVSYTHLRAHETVLDLVCRLLLEKKKTKN